MAFTLDMLNALDKAIAAGVTQVMYGNKIVMYKTTAEMLRVRALMAEELGLKKSSSNRKYGEFNKGTQ